MIEEIRGEIRVLQENIEGNNNVIADKREKIDDLRYEINRLETEINHLRDNNETYISKITEYEEKIEQLQQKDSLVEQLTEIVQNLTVEQLQAIISAANNPEETPAIHVNVQAPERVIESAEDVRFEDLTDAMHNAMLTVVGVRHQEYYRELHKSPEIGDIITLHKETETSNTYAVLNGHTIGVMPAGESKIEQLQNIGANYVNNQELTPDSDIVNQEYEVVGVIPGCFTFLNPKTSNTLPLETAEGDEVLEGSASSIDEARVIFRQNKPDTCDIVDITELPDRFIIKYHNHRCNTPEEYRNVTQIAKV